MCGIVFNNTGGLTNNDSLLKLQNHRGPDYTGVKLLDNKYFLGHNRLSILDLSGGNQPMKLVDGRYEILFNGEVYNFLELAKKFLSKEEVRGDTEVILELIEKYGVEIVEHFEGMFAIVLYDNLSKELILCRDHFGIKPLYYSIFDKYICVSSEPKVLYSWYKEVGGQLIFRKELLPEYFHCRSLQGSKTFVQDIFKVEPSVIMKFDLNKVVLTEVKHYNPILSDIDFKTDFSNVVNRHLRSDVPIGVFLSGGIDSTIIASFLDKGSTAFTARSNDPDLDEFHFAAEVAKKYSLNHVAIELGQLDIGALLRDYVYFNDDPVSDPSALGLFALCKEISSRGIKVVLAGEGADELFLGYNSYLRYSLIFILKKILPSGIAKFILRKLKFVNRTFEDYSDYDSFMGSSHISSYSEKRKIILNQDDLNRFYSSFKKEFQDLSLKSELKKDIYNRLPSDILMRTDRASMAWGLEVRTPFLVPSIKGFSDKLDFRELVCLTKLTTKPFLKRLVRLDFGSKFVNRKKRGFDMNVHEWITVLTPRIEQFILNKSIPGINYNSLSSNNIQSNVALYWSWITLELWYEKFINENSN
jgi:asparagine synthase (glutamine-hydrolysing)